MFTNGNFTWLKLLKIRVWVIRKNILIIKFNYREKLRQVDSETNGTDSNGNKTYLTLFKKFMDKMIVKIAVYSVLIFLFNYFYFESLIPCPIEPYDITLCVEWIQKI